MDDLAQRMCLAGLESTDPVDRQLAGIIADDVYRMFRRRPLPEEVAPGRSICAFDLALQAAWVKDVRRLDPLPCLIDRDPRGGALVVPHHIVEEAMRVLNAT